jgi:hypothetical protein
LGSSAHPLKDHSPQGPIVRSHATPHAPYHPQTGNPPHNPIPPGVHWPTSACGSSIWRNIARCLGVALCVCFCNRIGSMGRDTLRTVILRRMAIKTNREHKKQSGHAMPDQSLRQVSPTCRRLPSTLAWPGTSFPLKPDPLPAMRGGCVHHRRGVCVPHSSCGDGCPGGLLNVRLLAAADGFSDFQGFGSASVARDGVIQ